MNFLALTFAALSLANTSKQICFFSLNEEKEFHVTKDFMTKLNKVSPTLIVVKEFMSQGDKPNQAFKKMMDSGTKCDGLVISGHHVATYGGKRAKGRLDLNYLETLACDPKYSEWFRNISATWLQGCRTLGVGEIAQDNESVDADHHTNRVGRVLEEDNLDHNFAELNMEFSSTLDQDNPLASRYLRVFPEAKIFGWTKSAPGTKSHSWNSILYHMAQTSRHLSADNSFPSESPQSSEISAKSAVDYANAVLLTLKKFSVDQKRCEDFAIQGWLSHGNVGYPTKFRFDNPDLRAYSSLANNSDGRLEEAKEIDCALKAAVKNEDQALLSRTLDRILSDPQLFRYSFNTIVDLRKQLAGKSDAAANIILHKMQNHPGTQIFLESKIRSPQVGTLRKIDYYRFQEDLFGKPNIEVGHAIAKNAIKELGRPLPPTDEGAENPNRSRILASNYRATLFQSLLKNGIVGKDFYSELLRSNPEGDVLYSMARYAKEFNPKNSSTLLIAISNSPQADRSVGRRVSRELVQVMGIAEFDQIQPQIAARLEPVVPTWGVTNESYPTLNTRESASPAAPVPRPTRPRPAQDFDFTRPLGN